MPPQLLDVPEWDVESAELIGLLPSAHSRMPAAGERSENPPSGEGRAAPASKRRAGRATKDRGQPRKRDESPAAQPEDTLAQPDQSSEVSEQTAKKMKLKAKAKARKAAKRARRAEEVAQQMAAEEAAMPSQQQSGAGGDGGGGEGMQVDDELPPKHVRKRLKRQAAREAKKAAKAKAAVVSPEAAAERARTPETPPISSLSLRDESGPGNAAQVPAEAATTKRRKGKRTAAERLQGARFRMLNEKLYTTSGDSAYQLFSSNPSLFDVYHEGFKTQVQRWPVNPVDVLVEYLRELPSSLVVADFGCGEAAIAQSVENKVHSFDLVACNDHVTACDMAHVPLPKKSVDIAIFCLSLMGTNFMEYLLEAHRVMKLEGTLKVAEVKSRIKDAEQFVTAVEEVGFEYITQDVENTHFVEFEFRKVSSKARAPKPEAADLLGPCIYKRR